MTRKGWRSEPIRHGLAAQGIETSINECKGKEVNREGKESKGADDKKYIVYRQSRNPRTGQVRHEVDEEVFDTFEKAKEYIQEKKTPRKHTIKSKEWYNECKGKQVSEERVSDFVKDLREEDFTARQTYEEAKAKFPNKSRLEVRSIVDENFSEKIEGML